jgi:hypothetical protein
MKHFIFLCFSTFLLSNVTYAGFAAHRIVGNNEVIQLDGKLDDAVWQKISGHQVFYQTQPLDKMKAHVRTEVKIAYDDQFLYVGIKAFDPQAELIRGPYARRDKLSNDQDYLGLYIDPSSAHKSAQFFYVNPRGAIMDGIYGDNTGEDSAPDYDFQVATDIQDDGWSAEYKIPFSSIAYDKKSETPWSLLVFRNMTRDQRFRMYSGEVTRATSCNLCFSNPIEGLKDLPSGTSWSVTPQLVMRSAKDELVGQSSSRKNSSDISVDFKFRPNSSTTIDAALNPDFSQIELDAPQLSGNTKFSIFVQEKRPFFLEGADIFRTQFNVISTRSISNPDVGLRYTKRDADSDFSILTSKDVAGGLVLIPNAYYTGYATRNVPSIATDARANFRFGTFSLGAVATDRTLMESRAYNRVAGPDMTWQIDKNQNMRAQLLMSSTTAQVDAQGNLVKGALTTGHAAAFDWSRGNDDWAVSLSWRDISKDFRADNGFFSQVAYKSTSTDIIRKYRKIGLFNEINVVLHGDYKFDSEGNKLYQNWSPSIRMNGPYDSQASISINPNNQTRVKYAGELFTTSKISAGISLSPSKEIAKIGADISYGDVIDIAADRIGKGGSFSASAKLRPIDRLEIEPNFASSWINGIDNKAYQESAFQLNSIVHFSSKDTIRLILQESRTMRNQSLYGNKVVTKSSRSVRSLVYAHSERLGTATYIGLTLTESDNPGFGQRRKQSEIFAKFSWQL